MTTESQQSEPEEKIEPKTKTLENRLSLAHYEREAKNIEKVCRDTVNTLQQQVEGVKDQELKNKLSAQLHELEANAKKGEALREKEAQLKLEQIKAGIQAGIEESKTTNRMRYIDRFLERESVSSLLGAFILIVITIALLIAMFTQPHAREIVYNGFLILLGYFFGQTVAKAATNRTPLTSD